MYKYDKYTTAAATWPGRNWMHTVVSRLSLTKLVAACAGQPVPATPQQQGGRGGAVASGVRGAQKECEHDRSKRNADKNLRERPRALPGLVIGLLG